MIPTVANLRAAYLEGRLTLRDMVQRQRALALADEHNAWIYVLSEAELALYLDDLDGKDPTDLPLYGIPFAVKDNIDVAHVPTTAACPAFSYVPTESATVVRRLVAAGAIPIGKTNLDQFATGLVGVRSPYGETKNALNPAYISGGSSAGSAVATALGQVSFALGTDTAGSGRVPTGFNNIIGHKPSLGLISNRGVVPACRTLDSVSVMAMTTADVAQVLAQCVAFDPEDPYSRCNSYSNTPRYFGGVPNEFHFGVPQAPDFDGDDEARALFQVSVEVLESLGGTAVELDFEPFLTAAKLLYAGPWVAERRLATTGVEVADLLPVLQEILASGAGATAEDAFAAQYTLAALKRTCDQALSQVDFVLSPTTPTVYARSQISADPIALNTKIGTYTNFMNLLDYTATAVPVGMLSSGVGWGVTLFANRETDYALLSMAQQLQENLALPLGASGKGEVAPAPEAAPYLDQLDIVVCGAHLEGQPLNWQLKERGANLKQTTTTSPNYALFALADNKRPALIRRGGAAIEVEVWSMPTPTWGSFVHGIAAPLGIGKVELADGSWVSGFICADGVPEGAVEISEYGGWRNWKAQR